MPISNISLAKHINLEPLAFADIRIGLEVYFPAVTGGVLRHRCLEFDGETATFASTDDLWPSIWTIQSNVPDLTVCEFHALAEALKKFGINSLGIMPNDADRAIVHRARSLGYAGVQSYTQACWTEAGIAAYRAACGPQAFKVAG